MPQLSKNQSRPLLCYFGHHKCATQWIRSVMAQICKMMQLKIKVVNTPEDFGGNLPEFVKTQNVECLVYLNADWKYVKHLKKIRAFHVIRDPRDVCVSAYFSHLYSHSVSSKKANFISALRNELKNMTCEEGITREIDFCWNVFAHMENWNYDCPSILEVKFEQLTVNPYKHFTNIFRFLGCLAAEETNQEAESSLRKMMTKIKVVMKMKEAKKEITDQQLKALLARNCFKQKSKGRNLGEENIKSHYRKGISGDWVNYFSAEQIELFQQKYPNLLKKTEYE